MQCLILNIHFDRFHLFDKAHFDKATIIFWLFKKKKKKTSLKVKFC